MFIKQRRAAKNVLVVLIVALVLPKIKMAVVAATKTLSINKL